MRTQRLNLTIVVLSFIFILGFVFLFSPPAHAATPVTLAKQAIAVIKAKGAVAPQEKLTGTEVTAHGWYYTLNPICGVAGAATYLKASDGSENLSVMIIIPMNGTKPDVILTMSDLNIDGAPDVMTQDGDGALLPDDLTRRIFNSALVCIVNPTPPK